MRSIAYWLRKIYEQLVLNGEKQDLTNAKLDAILGELQTKDVDSFAVTVDQPTNQ